MSEEQQFDYKYIYDDVTKEFLRTQEVEYDYKGNEVMYPCETRIEPPECRDFEIQVFDEGLQRWSIVEDHRGRDVYLKGKEWKKWNQLGPLPEDTTFEAINGAITLTDAKSQTITQIKRYRDRAKASGFEYNGKVYDCDQNSFMSMSAYESSARASLSNGTEFTPITWITKDNSAVTLVAEDFIGLMDAYSKHVSLVNAHAVELKNAISGIQIPDGKDDLKVRERIAIDMVEGYDLSFRDVVPEGCDPIGAYQNPMDDINS